MRFNYKHIIFFILIHITGNCFAQNEAANWYFGQNAGLNFNFGYPIPETNGQLVTTEGCSTISDRLGNLLFYSDGITVWNKNHQVMQNGTGLLGDESSTQSALIIPKPDDNNIYYIFTVDDRAGDGGLQYSEVNMALGAGLGAVTANKNILLENPTTEKITAIESSDGESIWVISHKWNSNEFIAYLVSDAGVNRTPVISAIGATHTGNRNNTIGYLKASPNREKIACVKSYFDNSTQIFDFDATTGILTNPITIANYSTETLGPYGCEFSPDSNLLYVTEINIESDISKVHQYDLTQPNQTSVINSDVIVAEEIGETFGALQQAIDGKIYLAIQNGEYLAVISDPNEIGVACNYELEGVHLAGRISRLGLPPFIQSYFFATNIFRNTCFGDATEFEINTSTVIDNISWNFGDPASGANNMSTDLTPSHVFSRIGEYIVTITIDTEGDIQTVYRTVIISNRPDILTLDPLQACEIDNGFAEFDLISAIPTDIINDPTIAISFYEELNDAENFDNQITNVNIYSNVTNPQTVYVRLQNSIRGDCYSISELTLVVTENPIVEETESVFFCENSDDASVTIDVGTLMGNVSDYTFLWLETLETTPEIVVNNQGVYTVRITPTSSITTQNPDGCYADRIVTVSSSGIATINDVEVFNSNSITVMASGLGDYEYAVDSITGPYQDSTTFHNLEPGLHTVYVRDKNTCGIAEAIFSIIGFPKFFTPNGDGDNDTWQVQGISAQFQPNSRVLIFDRYGKLLKELSPLGEGWNGTFNGNPLPTDGYWFSVTLQDGRIFKDHFTLKR